MIENIRLLFSKMNDNTRDKALLCLMVQFHLESKNYIRKNWVIGGRIPKKNQKRVLYVFHELLEEEALVIRAMEVIL